MATVSRLSIMIDANASGVTKELATVGNQLRGFQGAVANAVGGVANRSGAVIATFLTVEKIIGRIKRAFAELKNLGPLLTPAELANVTAMQSAWAGINREIDLTILRIGGELAPAFITILENANALIAPLFTANDIIKGIGDGVLWIGEQWANLQSLVSGLFLELQVVADATFGKWQAKLDLLTTTMEKASGIDLFSNDGAEDRLRQEITSTVDLMRQANDMVGNGLSGQAGRDYLAQVEAKRKEIADAANSAVKEQGKVADAAIRAQLMQPGALTLGSSAAVSAANAARREQDGSKKIMLDQLKELRKLTAQKPVVLAPANI